MLLVIGQANAQEAYKDSLGYEYFDLPDGDSVMVMKKYYMVFLVSGPTRSQSPEEAAEIQKNHLEHLSWLYKEGYSVMAGPFEDNGSVRGIVVLNVPTQAEAERLTSMDPAVKAGRLAVEVHPWWAAVGATLR